MNQYCTRFFIVFTAIISSSNSKYCTFRYPTDFPSEESVLVWDYRLLILPDNNDIVLKANDKIVIVCPGRTNFLVKTGEKFSEATCVEDDTLAIGDISYKFSDLACSTSVTGEFQATTTTCANSKGLVKHVGYYVDEKFLTLFDICYDNNNGLTLYANHGIIGGAINYAKKEIKRICSNRKGLAVGVNATNYKQKAQLQIFTELLGSANLANQYIYPGSYLVAGYLAPYEDQVYATYALSTYFYINSVPQWKQINKGNWKSLEYSIRKVASNSGDDLQISTGGWQILQLEDVNGNLADIYLSGAKLPVPKFMWKVAYSVETQKGIAFVIVNNPFLNKVTEDYICTNICDTYGWGTTDWTNLTKGLLYCCEVDELKKIINIIPYFDVKGILEGSSATKLLGKLFKSK